MAETEAQNVVNGNQSMGGDPAPVDAPEETQSSNHAVGEGDVEVYKTQDDDGFSQSQKYSKDTSNAYAQSQLAYHQAHLEPSAANDGTTSFASQLSNQQNGMLHPEYAVTNGNIPLSAYSDPSPSATEAAELEWRRPSLDRNDRSNLFKKPTSFKTVSVTKNFLAKSSSGLASPNKTGVDKVSSPSPVPSANASAAKPRLIAKSVRDARSPALAGPGAAAAPDASKVWNRNKRKKAAPTPPPRQFTDEELKQQYGIHLATRLQSDEPGKGSKWADMEDDEDDWAPETVEWMDGTKTTLQPENQQPPPSASRLSPQKQESDEPKPDASASQPSSSLGPGKTILRPGGIRNQTTLKPGLVLKSVPESQEPPPKPTPNGSAKSPWAQLPPVDKVSPVTFNPPHVPSQQMPSHVGRESPAAASTSGPVADPNLATPSSAREISADTFDRSWRNTERGAKDLYEPKSGRYEPARGGRRTSFRQDGNFRPASLLQRPSQFDQDKGYVSQDVRSSDRRLSNLSSDSRVTLDRKVSAAEDGQASESALSPLVARSDVSVQHASTPDTSQPSHDGNQRLYAAHPADAAVTSPHVDGASSDVQLQQQLMRQRIEANRRRKQEEQAREEAEKQERIRQRLQALDITSPRPAEPEKIEAAGHNLSTEPTLNSSTATIEKIQSPPSGDDTTIVSETQSKQIPAVASLPPVATEETPQHLDGLGEVPANGSLIHLPPASHPSLSHTANSGISVPPSTQPSRFSSGQPLAPLNKSSPSPRLSSANFLHSSSSQPSSQPSSQHPSQLPSQFLKVFSDSAQPSSSDNPAFTHTHTPSPASFERSRHHWASAHPPLPQAGWSSNSGHPSSFIQSNVWGPPPTNDKALGNGSFEPDLHRPAQPNYPSSHFRPSPQPSPGPIAPPSVSSRPHSSSRPDFASQSHQNINAMAPIECVASPSTPNFPKDEKPKGRGSSSSTAPKQSAAHMPGVNFDPNAYGAPKGYGGPKGSGGSKGYGGSGARGNGHKGLDEATRAAAMAAGNRWQTTNTIVEDAAKKAAVVKAQREAKHAEPTQATGRVIKASYKGAEEPMTETVTDQPKPAAINDTAAAVAHATAVGNDIPKDEVKPIPAFDIPSEAIDALMAENKAKLIVKLHAEDIERTIIRVLNQAVAIKFPNDQGSAHVPHSAPPTQTQFAAPGSQPIINNRMWQKAFYDLTKDLGPQNKVSPAQAATMELAATNTASKLSIHHQTVFSIAPQPPVSLPIDPPVGGIKPDNVSTSESKDQDTAVFKEPEAASRPHITVPTDAPAISESLAESTLYQKRAESPKARTVSPPSLSTSPSAEEMERRVQIVKDLAAKYSPKNHWNTPGTFMNKQPAATNASVTHSKTLKYIHTAHDGRVTHHYVPTPAPVPASNTTAAVNAPQVSTTAVTADSGPKAPGAASMVSAAKPVTTATVQPPGSGSKAATTNVQPSAPRAPVPMAAYNTVDINSVSAKELNEQVARNVEITKQITAKYSPPASFTKMATANRNTNQNNGNAYNGNRSSTSTGGDKRSAWAKPPKGRNPPARKNW
ncbi:MAG: hypothetical protein Q9162_005071 [Coniocarpon cinnabarinum]